MDNSDPRSGEPSSLESHPADRKHPLQKKTTIVISSYDVGGVRARIQIAIDEHLNKLTGLDYHKRNNLVIGASGGCISALSSIALHNGPDNKPVALTPNITGRLFETGAQQIFALPKPRLMDKFNLAATPLGRAESIIRMVRRTWKTISLFDRSIQESVFRANFEDITPEKTTLPFVFLSLTSKGSPYEEFVPTYITNTPEIKNALLDYRSNTIQGSYARILQAHPKSDILQSLLLCINPPLMFNQTTVLFQTADGKTRQLFGRDAHVFARSPESIAFGLGMAVAKQRGLQEDQYRIVVLSLGTGQEPKPPPVNNKRDELLYELGHALGTGTAILTDHDRAILARNMAQRGHALVRINPLLGHDETSPQPGIRGMMNGSIDNMHKCRSIVDTLFDNALNYGTDPQIPAVVEILKAIHDPNKDDEEVNNLINQYNEMIGVRIGQGASIQKPIKKTNPITKTLRRLITRRVA